MESKRDLKAITPCSGKEEHSLTGEGNMWEAVEEDSFLLVT